MNLKKFILRAIAVAPGLFSAYGAPVNVIMNKELPVFTLAPKAGGEAVNVGEADENFTYSFDVPAGEYVLTGFEADSTTVTGTIGVKIVDSDEPQEIKLIRAQVRVKNKNEDGSQWTAENGDFTFDVTVSSREGVPQDITTGTFKDDDFTYITFLLFNGNSYNLTITPSEAHKA